MTDLVFISIYLIGFLSDKTLRRGGRRRPYGLAVGGDLPHPIKAKNLTVIDFHHPIKAKNLTIIDLPNLTKIKNLTVEGFYNQTNQACITAQQHNKTE